MGYQPQPGGYKHNRLIAHGHSSTRKQREIIRRIIEQGPSPVELYQLLTALALLTSQIDDILNDLQQFGKEPNK